MSLQQPLRSTDPEPPRTHSVLSLDEFLRLLRLEEDYFPGEQQDTSRMITRLRKIFYGTPEWNIILIKRAAWIQGRYVIAKVECPPAVSGTMTLGIIENFVDYKSRPKCKIVTYRAGDVDERGRSRVGKIPEIYVDDHADVRLPDGYHCDIGHVLAGLDALQYPQTVEPPVGYPASTTAILPPRATNNSDVCTWLGDIATSAAYFLFQFKDTGQPPNEAAMQDIIDVKASASDMVGNIDSYVIHQMLGEGKFRSRRVSEILKEYYGNGNPTDPYNNRYTMFTKYVGLGDLRAGRFSNEVRWLNNYETELLATTCFMIFAFEENPLLKIKLANEAWNHQYDSILKVKELLRLFVEALKQLM